PRQTPVEPVCHEVQGHLGGSSRQRRFPTFKVLLHFASIVLTCKSVLANCQTVQAASALAGFALSFRGGSRLLFPSTSSLSAAASAPQPSPSSWPEAAHASSSSKKSSNSATASAAKRSFPGVSQKHANSVLPICSCNRAVKLFLSWKWASARGTS